MAHCSVRPYSSSNVADKRGSNVAPHGLASKSRMYGTRNSGWNSELKCMELGTRLLRMYGTRNSGCREPNSEHKKLGTRNSWVGESGTRDVWNADGLGLRMYGTQNSDCMELRSLELRMYGNQNSECVGLKKFELKCIVSKGQNSECICLRY